MTEPDDVEIQIRTVTEHCLSELKKKKEFQGMEFDLILRDFSSALYLRLETISSPTVMKTMLDKSLYEMIKKPMIEFVLERVGLAPPTYHFHNGDREEYEKNIAFFSELRNTRLLEEFESVAGHDHLIHWITSNDNHDSFFKELSNRHPSLFSYYGYEQTVAELSDVLKAVAERKYRSEAIYYHIRDRKGIEDRLLGVYDWQKNHSKSWFDKMREYIPKFYIPGFQFFTVTEIVPVGLSDYFSPMGGKTIKLGSFTDLNKEFIMAQHDAFGIDITKIDQQVLAELRDFLIPMAAARRFIFPEAIDMIMEYTDKKNKQGMPCISCGCDSRQKIFSEFYNYSIDLCDKMYKLHEVLCNQKDISLESNKP